MRVVRVYTGDDGRSHFENVRVPLEDNGPLGRISQLIRGSGVMFREVGGDYDLDFHNAPRRQFVVNLEGAVDIGVGDGTVERLGPGDILLAEDADGEVPHQPGGRRQTPTVPLHPDRRRRPTVAAGHCRSCRCGV